MDLSNASNWALIHSSSVAVTKTIRWRGYEYPPLPDVELSLATPVCIVKTQSFSALEEKGLGAWMFVFLDLAGQLTRITKRICYLNASTFVTLPNFGVVPYKVKFVFPYKLEDMNLDVWQFVDESGRYLDQDESVLYTATEIVEQRQRELQQQISQIQQQLFSGG